MVIEFCRLFYSLNQIPISLTKSGKFPYLIPILERVDSDSDTTPDSHRRRSPDFLQPRFA